jgi:hypothetical protein
MTGVTRPTEEGQYFLGSANSAGSGNIVIQSAIIQTQDPKDLYKQIQAQSTRAAIARGLSLYAADAGAR